MKRSYLIFIIFVLGICGCDSFLSEAPDNRLRPDNVEQVKALLVNAYPEGSWYFVEWMTDNVGKTPGNMMLPYMTETYTFQKVRSTFQDTPAYYWTSAYRAIAHANQAMISLDEIACSEEDRKIIMAEALLCRSYAHFMLVNLFAPHYDAATAETTPGVPYIKDMEDRLIMEYERESVASVYKKAEEDMLEGIRLKKEISENSYKALKYHFSLNAAYAYASRFYLFMGNYGKVIEYANALMGEGYNSKFIRDYNNINKGNSIVNAQNFCSYDDASNIMLGRKEVYADPYYQIGYRLTYDIYGDIFFKKEDDLRAAQLFVGNSTRTAYWFSKFYWALENEAYAYEIMPIFRGEEVFLNRLEALAKEGNVKEVDKQLQKFVENRYTGSEMGPLKYSDYIDSYKSRLNPDITEEDMFIQIIIDERRREFVQEGMRWFDLKRFKLFPVVHVDINSNSYTMTLDRAALEIPDEAIANGLEPNYKKESTVTINE